MTQRRRKTATGTAAAEPAPEVATGAADAPDAPEQQPAPVTTGRRRRRLPSNQMEMPSNPGDTAEPEGDRWSGDPDEPAPYQGDASAPAEASAAAPANDVQPSAERPKPSLVSAPAPSAKDRHPLPWGLVISDVFNLDVHKTFARLESELSLGDSATEYGTVLRAVDQSSRNLFDAARLARKAKLEDERFSAELDKRLEVLRTEAIRGLEAEKRSGERSKSPTLKDIEDRMLSNWPDEMLTIKARKEEMHGALRAIEALEQAWRDRCQSLRTLATQFSRAGA